MASLAFGLSDVSLHLNLGFGYAEHGYLGVTIVLKNSSSEDIVA